MSEHQRHERIRKLTEAVSKEFVDKGLLIEAGFVSLMAAAYPPNVPKDQFDQLRLAFFAGAQHLFGSIMNFLGPGEEPTDDDMNRMDLIDKELRRFIVEFEEKHGMRQKPHPTAQ